jgi:hypothetical protein
MWRPHEIRGLAHVLLILVFVSLGSLPQLALCTGPAGHRALELRDATCCRASEIAGDAGGIQALRFGCASYCSDTPLGVVAAAQRPDQFYGTVTGTSCLLPISGVVPLKGIHGLRLAPWPIPPLDFAPRALRSTVALC